MNGAGESGQGASFRPGLPAGLRLPAQGGAGLVLVSEQRFSDLIVAERRLRIAEAQIQEQASQFSRSSNTETLLRRQSQEFRALVSELHKATLEEPTDGRKHVRKSHPRVWAAIEKLIAFAD